MAGKSDLDIFLPGIHYFKGAQRHYLITSKGRSTKHRFQFVRSAYIKFYFQSNIVYFQFYFQSNITYFQIYFQIKYQVTEKPMVLFLVQYNLFLDLFLVQIPFYFQIHDLEIYRKQAIFRLISAFLGYICSVSQLYSVSYFQNYVYIWLFLD